MKKKCKDEMYKWNMLRKGGRLFLEFFLPPQILALWNFYCYMKKNNAIT